jgi:Mor family transcriptional regulator
MNYLRADLILPDELLSEIQKYVQDGLIYIPKPRNLHKKWGEASGTREFIHQRNKEIKDKFQNSSCIEQLAQEYYLSIETIKRIVYTK